MAKIVIDPVTRIEGHHKIEAVVDAGEVKEARCTGNLLRGIEIMMRGRDPRDATVITQRICGVCPQDHGNASALCLDSAFGVDDQIPDNARLMRNLILGAHMVQDHILHFYTRRASASEFSFGDADFHLEQLASRVGHRQRA